jgi:hypothetical protein
MRRESLSDSDNPRVTNGAGGSLAVARGRIVIENEVEGIKGKVEKGFRESWLDVA